MRPRSLIGFIAVIQTVLFLTHFLLYETWTFYPAGSDPHGALWIKLLFGFLSVSFVSASLLAFATQMLLCARFTGLAGLDVNLHRIVELLFGVAVVAGLYGVFNASWTRITVVKL